MYYKCIVLQTDFIQKNEDSYSLQIYIILHSRLYRFFFFNAPPIRGRNRRGFCIYIANKLEFQGVKMKALCSSLARFNVMIIRTHTRITMVTYIHKEFISRYYGNIHTCIRNTCKE